VPALRKPTTGASIAFLIPWRRGLRVRATLIAGFNEVETSTTLPQDQRAASDSSPVVSVITVCRNAAATLEACLDCVAGQSYAAVEHIVIDGASSDGTGEILARHRDRLAVLVAEPDRGIYDAMNKGLARASGEFVIFLNADDVFVGPDSVRDAMAEIAAQPDGDVYYGALEVRMAGGRHQHVPPPPDRAAEEMVLGCLPHQSTFARRAVFARTGPFDLRWRRHADYDWWIKVISDPGIRLRRIRTMVASFAAGGASSDLAKGQPEVYAIQNEAPLFRSPEWDRRRLEMFQQAYLAARIEAARLREAAVAAGIAPERSLRARIAGALPHPVVAALRSARRRLHHPNGPGA
jgi:glycosyltransferase involved in cell wall biosynthesis